MISKEKRHFIRNESLKHVELWGPGEDCPCLPCLLAVAANEIDSLEADVERWVEHYTNLLITGLEIESAHNDLRQRIRGFLKEAGYEVPNR